MTPPQSTGAGAGLRIENLVHVYGHAGTEVVALRGVDLSVQPGESLAVIGPSGSGKSTLLWLLAGLTRPTAGRIFLDQWPLHSATEAELTTLRARQVGVVLQNPARGLLAHGTALDNLLYAQVTTTRSWRAKQQHALELLDLVDLTELAHARAGGLSGGEQQRLALAVAMAADPRLLLADEPTSRLDADSATRLLALISRAQQATGVTVLMVTHDAAAAAALDRSITIRDGRIGQEHRDGQQYVVIGREGALHLPPEVAEQFPEGTLAKVVMLPDGIALHPLDPGEQA